MSAPAGDVADRLERLAAHAPAAGVDPDRLWQRGRRRQGRRWAAAVACAVALAGVGAVTVAPLARLLDPPVADNPDSAWVLPEAVRQPGGWEPAFGRAPGRLSAIGTGSRSGWLSTHPAFWGVSATTGESRWLDLPVTASDDPALLSEDGTKLAYWLSDGVAGDRGDGKLPAPTELRLLDLVSGDEQRWAPANDYGLMTDGMAWAGDTLWFGAGALLDADRDSARTSFHSWTWGSTARDVGELTSGQIDLTSAIPDAGGFLAMGDPEARRAWRVTSSDVPTQVTFDMGGTLSTPSISPDDRIIAGIHQKRTEQEYDVDRMLLAGNVEDGRANMRRVGPIRAARVLGWRSPTEVITASAPDGYASTGVPGSRQVAVTDVRDPVDFRFSHLLYVEGPDIPAFASDAWAAEIVPAPSRPFAPDPRLVAGGAVVLAFLFVGWRRTRRLRGRP